MLDEKQLVIIRKIKKLFRLAEGAGSAEEARSAALRARELLSAYNLELRDVREFREEDCAEAPSIIKSRSIPRHVSLLAHATSLLFQCKTITERRYGGDLNRQRISFIGVGADALLASQTFEFLLEVLRRETLGLRLPPREKTDFGNAFANAVHGRVEEMLANLEKSSRENALVPVKKAAIDDYIERRFPAVFMRNFSMKGRSGAAALLGARAGARVRLDRQLGGRSSRGLGH